MNKEEAITRSMRANKQSDTSIEITLRRALWHRGVRFRKNVKDVLGTPDIVIKKYKLVVFCDGDFWHGRKYTENSFFTNKKYWDNKIKKNIERDLEYTIALRDQGWIVLRFWESDIRKKLNDCVEQILQVINAKKHKQRIL